jgi:maltooligosyltrehalose synthase
MAEPPEPLLATLLHTLEERAHTPLATYRLQFNATFTFAQACALLPYLHALGITTCYASPYLQARPGSMHGYDIVSHQALNPEIGRPTVILRECLPTLLEQLGDSHPLA